MQSAIVVRCFEWRYSSDIVSHWKDVMSGRTTFVQSTHSADAAKGPADEMDARIKIDRGLYLVYEPSKTRLSQGEAAIRS